MSRELIAPEYVLCTGARRTNCLRCSSLLVMNFFVRIVTAPSDMVAPKDLQPKGGHVSSRRKRGVVNIMGSAGGQWCGVRRPEAAVLGGPAIRCSDPRGVAARGEGRAAWRGGRPHRKKPRKNVSRRIKRPGLPSPLLVKRTNTNVDSKTTVPPREKGPRASLDISQSSSRDEKMLPTSAMTIL